MILNRTRHFDMTSLYVLKGEYMALANKLADMDLDAQTIADTIESTGLTDSISEKGQNIVLLARSIEQHNDAIKAEIDRLQALLQARKARAVALHKYLLTNMLETGIDSIDGPLVSISIRNNPEAVDVFEPGLVPLEYMRQPDPPPPDKTAIKAALKAGRDVPGCRLTQSQRLAIK